MFAMGLAPEINLKYVFNNSNTEHTQLIVCAKIIIAFMAT